MIKIKKEHREEIEELHKEVQKNKTLMMGFAEQEYKAKLEMWNKLQEYYPEVKRDCNYTLDVVKWTIKECNGTFS